jgi:hypothetical protein
VVDAALDAPLAFVDVRLVDPRGVAVQHRHAHPFRTGQLCITRADGHQFEAGAWAVELRGDAGAGATRQYSATLSLSPAAESSLAAAPLPDALTGSDGQPVASIAPGS